MIIHQPAAKETAASAQAARDFSIAAGPMDGALVAYARQADVQLLYTAELVAGLQTPGVSGRHAPDAALDRLLTGTGVVPDNDFTLAAQDVVRIHVSGIGAIENPVVVV